MEQPGGEYGRGMPAVFDLYNRGKRSVTLDLRTDEGRCGLLEPVADFDVFVESFRPGYLDGLGLGSARTREQARGSRLLSGRPGTAASAPIATARTRPQLHGARRPPAPAGATRDRPPDPLHRHGRRAGRRVRDLRRAGRYPRWRAGACIVDVAMTDVAISFNGLAVGQDGRRAGGTTPTDGRARRVPVARAGPVAQTPCYGVYETADGRDGRSPTSSRSSGRPS